MTTEIIYIGYDNNIELKLLEDGAALTEEKMQAITKIALKYNGNTYDSVSNAEVFDWATRASEAVVVIAMGMISGLVAGRDLGSELIVYDATNPNGIVWGSFSIKAITI